MSSPATTTPPPEDAFLPASSASPSGASSPASSSGDRANIPVPDELAQVRADLKRLEDREQELRRILLTDPSARTGANYLAEIKVVRQDRTDWKELRANYPAICDEFTFAIEQTRVVLMGVTEDGEIVSARKLKATKD